MLSPRQTKAARSKRAFASIAAPADSVVKRINSQYLFQQMNEVEIEHEGRIYRLRVTQLNKLILTA